MHAQRRGLIVAGLFAGAFIGCQTLVHPDRDRIPDGGSGGAGCDAGTADADAFEETGCDAVAPVAVVEEGGAGAQ